MIGEEAGAGSGELEGMPEGIHKPGSVYCGAAHESEAVLARLQKDLHENGGCSAAKLTPSQKYSSSRSRSSNVDVTGAANFSLDGWQMIATPRSGRKSGRNFSYIPPQVNMNVA